MNNETPATTLTSEQLDFNQRATAYLAKLGAEEYAWFRALGGKQGEYYPSTYHLALIRALNEGDREWFESLVDISGPNSVLAIKGVTL